jgi:hypothetical protein
MINVSNIKQEKLIRLVAGAVAVKKGQLMCTPSTGVIAATAAQATNTLIGVSLEACDAAAICTMAPLSGTDLEIDTYQGGTLKEFADADLGKLFDIVVTSGDMTIDPNDTTGGFLCLVGYNNVSKVAYVRPINSGIYLS